MREHSKLVAPSLASHHSSPLAAALLVVALAGVLAIGSSPVSASAAEMSSVGAGNVFSTEGAPALASGVDHDLYWTGSELSLEGAKVGQDVIAAGQDLSLSGCSIGSSLRSASRSLTVSGCVINGNVTSAGEDVTFGEGSQASGVYLAGRDVTFSGTCSDLAAAGETVTIAGTVDGDAHVSAKHVVVKDGATITGTLDIQSSDQPEVSSAAKVGHLSVSIESDSSDDTAVSGTIDLLGYLYFAAAFCVIALLLTLVLPVAVDGSAAMARKRTAPLVVSGVVGLVAMIPAVIILCVLFLTLPLAGGLLAFLLTLFMVAVPFAAASVTRLVFPGWNRFGAAALGGAVLGVATKVPFLGVVVVLASFVYLLGYVIQCAWLGMHAPSAHDSEGHGHDCCDHERGDDDSQGLPPAPQASVE
ncbi:MAG: polymer-forming cytoskeletal protein [Atopobiaceae bacterium]|jgi:cytoskeletal protein CcmA (bactofilin family)|nr:polymer-forming cytoskeletal protein [Atopobiaceae bacterium]MCI2172854.1 polymer-forming cytoskeletal protein [Atopobiaceae bacterium]MCI2207161.1 polymer-forming cytoskeletal protein [Atopobiaceae bacterium]